MSAKEHVYRFMPLLSLGLLVGCNPTLATIRPPISETLLPRMDLGHGRQVQVVIPFRDQRPFPDRCGEDRMPGYPLIGAKRGEFSCEMPPTLWVSQALVNGLILNNFQVIPLAGGSPSPKTVRVEGEVVQFYAEPEVKFLSASAFEGDIGVRLVVTSPRGYAAERVFIVKGHGDGRLFDSRVGPETAMGDATQRIVSAMVRDIVMLLDDLDRRPISSMQETRPQ